MRTYLPTIKRTLIFLCGFIGRHRDRIVEVIGPENETALDNLVAACNIFTGICQLFDPDED